jgi:hypothetical protein|tara:strand:+ start:3026 stop:3691 length:666 start_codon:yes stop_codon:yes gene_type:complete
MGTIADMMAAGPFPYDARHQRGVSLMPGVANQVMSEYGAIAPHNPAVINQTSGGVSNGRRLEFYHPQASENPLPGRPSVGVFDPSIQGEDLTRLVAADFMHYLPSVDPKFATMRERMAQSMEPWQDDINRRAYDRAVDGTYGNGTYFEQRPYDEWFDAHRLDQFMGAGFLPKDGHSTMQTFGKSDHANWMRMMTPEQHGLLQEVEDYMRSGVKQPTMSWGQ